MTLVVAFSGGEFPAMVGDLLVSGPRQSEFVELPGPGNIAPVRSHDGGVWSVGLRQKLALLSRHLVIGWSGSEVAAYRVLSTLRARIGDGPVRLDDLFRELDGMNPADVEGLSLLGMLHDGSQTVRFHQNSHETEHHAYGKLFLAGSGVDDFLKRVDGIVDSFELRGSMNPVSKAMSAMLAYTGSVLVEEMTTQSSLGHCYGGGFEYVAPVIADDGLFAFEKIASITSLFWRADLDNRLLQKLPFMLNQRYRGDILEITRILDEVAVDGLVLQKRQVMSHFVTPIHRIVQPSEISSVREIPELDALFLVNYIVFKDSKSRQRVVNVIKTGPKPVRFTVNKLSYEMEWSKEFVDEVIDYVGAAAKAQ